MNQFWILDCRFSIGKSNANGIFCLALSCLLSGLCFSADAQQTKNVPRIGFLRFTAPLTPNIEAFKEALREQGYIEGKNIIIEYRYAEEKMDRLPALAHELVRLGVAAIVAVGPAAARAAVNATKSIPVIIAGSLDPVAEGIVTSLARPGANITGVARIHPEMDGKKLELLKEAVPRVAHVAFLWNPDIHEANLKEAETAGRLLKVQLQPVEFRSLDDSDSALQAASKARVDALMIPAGFSIAVRGRNPILDFAAKNRMASMVPNRQWVDDGGLMSYESPLVDLYRRAGLYVAKILKGAKPADLPVEQAKKFELVINLKTAKQIGLTIPPSVLARADKVIK